MSKSDKCLMVLFVVMISAIVSACVVWVFLSKLEQKGEAFECKSTYYADCGLIMDEPDDVVCVTMQNGNVFTFKDDDGDWSVGNLVSILFDDSGTPIVYDDKILDCRYSGWVSEEEFDNWIKCPNKKVWRQS